MKEPSVFLKHIVVCIEAVESYTKDFTKKEFLASPEKQDAVLHRIQIIGEATKSLPIEAKKDFPNVPWRKIAAMRDVIVHDYFEIDLELVWKTARQDLPKLRRELLKR
jgi:uncharacterized protein with HEPN domain